MIVKMVPILLIFTKYGNNHGKLSSKMFPKFTQFELISPYLLTHVVFYQ
jgi:hypothetical protein